MAKLVILNQLDKTLMESGFSDMSIYDKNELLVRIGDKKNLDYTSMSEKDVLDYHKELKRSVMSERCEQEILKGFTASNGNFYRTNRDDQVNMIGQKDTLIEDESITEVYWKTENKGYIKHSREEWLKIYGEAFEHKKYYLMKYDEVRNVIMNAKTHEEIIPIIWFEDEKKEEEEDSNEQ